MKFFKGIEFDATNNSFVFPKADSFYNVLSTTRRFIEERNKFAGFDGMDEYMPDLKINDVNVADELSEAIKCSGISKAWEAEGHKIEPVAEYGKLLAEDEVLASRIANMIESPAMAETSPEFQKAVKDTLIERFKDEMFPSGVMSKSDGVRRMQEIMGSNDTGISKEH